MKAAVLAFGMLLASSTAFAAKEHGVEVYPGAKPAPEVTKQLKEMNGVAYRTTDSVEQVASFYAKQPLKENPGRNKGGASFSMGDKVMVSIQNPWADMVTGKVSNDTLISIIKHP
jgi:hypothetical protein